MGAVPSKLTPLIARGVCNAVAVEALPVNAPAKLVDVTDDRPANVVAVAPNATLVEPIVTLLLVSDALAMFVNVLLEPLMVLFVSVSVVARPTTVSVDVGNVNVPVLTMVAMTGAVSVLFVNVCASVVPTTTPEGMAF